MTTPTSKPTQQTAKKEEEDKPGRWQVRLSHPGERKRRVFSTLSERRARAFVRNRFPRGEEAYLEAPDGHTESFQAERSGEHGEDASQWAPFDPEKYRPPEEQAAPGESAWQDVEG